MAEDNTRIDIQTQSALQNWATSLNTTPERLKLAVEAVGDRVDVVRRFLGESRRG